MRGTSGLRIFELLGRELKERGWSRFILLAAVSGVSSAAVLAIINRAAGSTRDADVLANSLMALIVAIIVYVYSQVSLMMMAASLAEQTVYGLRKRLLDTFRAAELIEVESLNRNEIFACINSEIRVISDGATSLMIIAQSIVLTLVTLCYIAVLSSTAFWLATGFIGIAASLHISRNRQIIGRHEHLFDLNTELMNRFSDLLDGFKEVKLNSARSDDLSTQIDTYSLTFSNEQLLMQRLFSTGFAASQVSFFLLTGIMVFIVPAFTTVDTATLSKITAAVLFIVGPISAVVAGLPAIQRLNAAAEAILSLEGKLQRIKYWSPAGTALEAEYSLIALTDVVFRYPVTADENGFSVGPVTMQIEREKVVFITGGNGSGKSTLLKLITGLYLPDKGTLLLDSKAVEGEMLLAYRNLFSAIFAENHLFKEFYGMSNANLAKVSDLLRLVELEHKVSIHERSFSTLALSSGQRKRLALVMALLEDRPIYVFDEWAADQDSHFRQKFYRDILPYLKASGKTVIAVTHDERFFDTADMRFHMEEGQLVEMTGEERSAGGYKEQVNPS